MFFAGGGGKHSFRPEKVQHNLMAAVKQKCDIYRRIKDQIILLFTIAMVNAPVLLATLSVSP